MCIYTDIQLQRKGNHMIKLENIHKLIGTFSLRDISAEIPKGYITGLIGRNGCGKTTLLYVLLGLYKPDEGVVSFGEDGKQYRTHEQEIKEEIGVVLQERLYDNDRSLWENGCFYGSFYKNFDKAYFKNCLEKYSLDPNKKYKHLSKGEEFKFQFVFALAHRPKYLFLDEPTGNFDPEFRAIFLKALSEFIADGEHSVLLITHLTEDLDKLADYIIYMEDGKVLLEMDMESFRNHYRIVTGEPGYMKYFSPEDRIHMELGEFTAKALVRNRPDSSFDKNYIVSTPTLEEFMYFVSKREEGTKLC